MGTLMMLRQPLCATTCSICAEYSAPGMSVTSATLTTRRSRIARAVTVLLSASCCGHACRARATCSGLLPRMLARCSDFTFQADEQAVVGAGQRHRALGDDVEHRLHVGG